MKRLAVVLAALVLMRMMSVPVALAQDDIEDPNMFEGVWYRIALDRDGAYILGDGDGYAGGTWYHYDEPNEQGWWRQWFYNGPYDPNSQGHLDYAVYIRANDPTLQTSLEVRFNWSTPEWSALGKRRPPLPTDLSTTESTDKYLKSRELQRVDNWFIGTIEPIKKHTIEEYNPEWVSIDIRGKNAHVYRGAYHFSLPKHPAMGACYDMAAGNCYTGYEDDCQAPYVWLGAGSSCSDYVAQGPFPIPVYRFWLPAQQTHVFSVSEREKDGLVAESEDVCVFEGAVYYAFMHDGHPDCLPVYRFWSDRLGVYFYTISEAERNKLETQYADVWTCEGPAFYAYPEGRQPADAVPVYRFWADVAGYHLYTVRESERDKLINEFPEAWIYEGVAWYAYRP